MGKKILTIGMLMFSTLSYTQESFNKWSVGIEGGMHGVISKTQAGVKSPNFNFYSANARYMANPNFGLMAQVGYNGFNFSTGNDEFERVNYLNFTLEGVANLGNIMRFSSWTKHIGLLLHAGPGGGLSGLNSDDYKVDKVLVGRLGLTPTFKLGERVTLTTDLTFNGHLKQSRAFDRFNNIKITGKGVDSYFFTSSVGLTFNLGKNVKHVDWNGEGAVDFSEYDRRIAALEAQLEAALADDDKDGVPNSKDQDNNTPAGTKVNAQGVAVDTAKEIKDADADGIVDQFDACPNLAGPFSTNGCPDKDKDGVADRDDQCPDQAGVAYNGGCPPEKVVTSEATNEVMKAALKGVNFQLGTAAILPSSYPKLDAVVKVLEENPRYNLNIKGHTDDVGNPAYNLELSNKRALAVKDYIIKKGIDRSRLVAKGYGEALPIANNTDLDGREANRRVEFEIF